MSEYPTAKNESGKKHRVAASTEGALFDLVESHETPKPDTPFIAPTSRFPAEERTAPDVHAELGYSQPIPDHDIDTKRAIVDRGLGSPAMKTEVARADHQDQIRNRFGLNGAPAPRSAAADAAAAEVIHDIHDDQFERAVDAAMKLDGMTLEEAENLARARQMRDPRKSA